MTIAAQPISVRPLPWRIRSKNCAPDRNPTHARKTAIPKSRRNVIAAVGHVENGASRMAEARQHDRNEHWPARQADAHAAVQAGQSQGNAADEHAQADAEEDGNQLRAIELLDRVAEFNRSTLHTAGRTDDDKLIREAKSQRCCRAQVDAGAGDARDGYAEAAW